MSCMALLLGFTAGCSDTVDDMGEAGSPDSPVEIGAAIAAPKALTRTGRETESRPVKGGRYTVIYPLGHGVASFGDKTTTDGNFGQGQLHAALVDDDNLTVSLGANTLTADQITSSEGRYRYTMDNLLVREKEPPYPGKVYFKGDVQKQFSAGKEKAIKTGMAGDDNKSNDLVWGEYEANTTDISSGKKLIFNLYHCMSRVSVVVVAEQFDNGSGEYTYNYNGEHPMRIWLDNMVKQPYSFNRATGTVYVAGESGEGEEPAAKDTLYLLGSPEAGTTPEFDQDETDRVNSGLQEGAQEAKCYTTENMILAPQHIDASNRPQLHVEFDGKTYSGYLPRQMNAVGIMEDLWFKGGYHLLLRVHFGEGNDLPLDFGIVELLDWTDITGVTVEANQAGINKLEDIKELISIYNSLASDSGKEIYLRRFGEKSGDVWKFDFFCDQDVNAWGAKFSKELYEKHPFTIDFNGWGITKGPEQDIWVYKYDKDNSHWIRQRSATQDEIDRSDNHLVKVEQTGGEVEYLYVEELTSATNANRLPDKLLETICE